MKSLYIPIIDLMFEFASDISKNNIEQIYTKLIKSGADDYSLGFWVWDIENDIEMYSPKFRATLQYEGIHDFPNRPESWMKAIIPEDKQIAIANYKKHIETQGVEPYSQTVTYNRKYNGQIKISCYGKVVTWKDGNPKIMIGIHQEANTYKKNILYN